LSTRIAEENPKKETSFNQISSARIAQDEPALLSLRSHLYQANIVSVATMDVKGIADSVFLGWMFIGTSPDHHQIIANMTLGFASAKA